MTLHSGRHGFCQHSPRFTLVAGDHHAHGYQVQVLLNGQVVNPDKIESLPDGRSLLTVNGVRVLIDLKQPGGESATLSVVHHDDKLNHQRVGYFHSTPGLYPIAA